MTWFGDDGDLFDLEPYTDSTLVDKPKPDPCALLARWQSYALAGGATAAEIVALLQETSDALDWYRSQE